MNKESVEGRNEGNKELTGTSQELGRNPTFKHTGSKALYWGATGREATRARVLEDSKRSTMLRAQCFEMCSGFEALNGGAHEVVARSISCPPTILSRQSRFTLAVPISYPPSLCFLPKPSTCVSTSSNPYSQLAYDMPLHASSVDPDEVPV